MRNEDVVKSIYEAFGRGDVSAILSRLARDVRWEHWTVDNRAQSAGVPWMQKRTGRAEVTKFFEALGALEFNEFQVREVVASGQVVVARVLFDITSRDSGRRYKEDELHWWVFDEAGQVTEFRHYADTAKHMDAAGRL